MSRFCVDTSAYSQFKRGHAPVVDLIDAAEWIGIPTIVLGELWMGFGLGDRLKRNAVELQTFLGNAVVETVPVDGEVARIFGEIAAELRKRGTPLPTNDIWIAASAVRTATPLLTYDAHFRRIERLESVILDPKAQ